MSLTKLKFASRVIESKMGPITVRGIAAEDIMLMLVNYRGSVESVFNAGTAEGIDDRQRLEAVATTLASFPELFGRAIAMVTGEGTVEEAEIARKLPFPLQLEIFKVTVELTFEGHGLKKSMELLIEMAQATSQSIQDLRAQPTGSGTSGESAAS